MSEIMRVARGVAIVTGALVALLGVARPAAAADKLTVISGSQPTAFFEVLGDVAAGAGFYTAENLDVDIQYAGNPYSAAQLVASGKGDICSLALEPIIQGYDKGVRLTSFFARDPHYEYVLGVPANSPIKSLADFKGQSIGEYSPGSGAEVSTNNMLEGAGLKRTDFSYSPIGNGAQAIQALNSGKVAGAAFPFVELQIYVVNADQHYRYFWHPILKDIGDVGYAATPATIQSKADLLKRFARANAKAALLIRVNPALAARYFVQAEGIKVTDDAVSKETRLLEISQDQLPGFDPSSNTIGKMSTAGMGFLSNFLYTNGLTPQLVPTSALVDNRFIAFANDFDHKAFLAEAKKMH
jgi:ABC-type nitrate/sulfonate/bicarbonate transport system substrate-binding protein